MKIAAIDVGSNSIHLVVVEADSVGNQRVLAREKTMVRLAKGIAKTGEIAPDAFQAGLETLALMAEITRGFKCDTIIAYGTTALREAGNAGRFSEEAAHLGIQIRVISGEEEARLIHLAVSHAIPFPDEPAVLVDIGGGSTELTWVHGERVLASTSLPWGLQRLADAIPTSNPPTPDDMARLGKFINKILKKAGKTLPRELPSTAIVLGTSGTLLDLAKGTGEATAFTREELLRFERKLWRATAQDRITNLLVDPKRAEVLHVGASWAVGILRWLDASQVRCLPVGLREGMIWEALRHGGMVLPALPDRRRRSVDALAERLDPDPGHSRHVQLLADQLFLDLRPAFELGETERELLGYSARLHDIGLSISEKGHQKHGAYLIQNASLGGFWPKECELISQIVRFHRGKAPDTRKHEAFGLLAPWHRHVVEKLAAILRVADALDRRRRQCVREVRLEIEAEEARLIIHGSGDLRPELEALQEKGKLLFHLLDLPVKIAIVERSS
ncbi:MAG: Ppx/GppA phosphatase family protein [Holophaga sp.]|nr:Ppx/GppA phosphatase family protein [Holophaga sp.]